MRSTCNILTCWQKTQLTHANMTTNLKLYTPATTKEPNLNWKRLQKTTSSAQIQILEGFTWVALSQSCIESDITVTSVLSEDGCSSPCEGHEIWKGTAAARGVTLMMQQEEERWLSLDTMENHGHLGRVRGCWKRGDSSGQYAGPDHKRALF